MRWLHSLTSCLQFCCLPRASTKREGRAGPAHQHAGADLYRHTGRRGARRQ